MGTFTSNRYWFVFLFAFLGACSPTEEPLPVQPGPQSTTIVKDTFQGEELIVYANADLGTMQAFRPMTSEGTTLDLEAVAGAFPVIFRDQEGNEWNIFGIAVKGPRKGEELATVTTMMAYWFSLAAMYPEVTLLGDTERDRIHYEPTDDWIIRTDALAIGTFQDGIQSLDQPKLDPFNTAFKNSNFISDEELVTVYHDGKEFRVFPHKILDWHEVINDQSTMGPFVISYCPLTGTSAVWNSQIAGSEHSFGVSGLLYNSNLILYDRTTESRWVQMRYEAVNGPLISTQPVTVPSLDITWEGARKLAENLQVLSDDTGFDRDYNLYPYGTHKTNDVIPYPLDFKDTRLHPKERVLGVIIGDKVKVYRFKDFE